MADSKNETLKPQDSIQIEPNSKNHPFADPSACKELKEKHDTCFYKWYSDKFLKGTITLDCKEEWEEYQYCLTQKLKAWNLEHLKKEQPEQKPK